MPCSEQKSEWRPEPANPRASAGVNGNALSHVLDARVGRNAEARLEQFEVVRDLPLAGGEVIADIHEGVQEKHGLAV